MSEHPAAPRLGAQGSSELRAAFGNMLAKALSVPVEKASRLLLVVVAAPLLGEAAFGRFQFADTVSALLIVATELGLGIWTTRALARAPERTAEIVTTGIAVKAAVALPYLALVAGTAFVVAPGETRGALLLLGVANLGGAFVEYCDTVFRGFERLRDEARLNVVRAVLTTAAGLGALLWWRTLLALAAGLVIGAVVAAAIGLAMVRRRAQLTAPLRAWRIDRGLARAAVAEALPLWLATLLSLVYFKGDVVLLRAFSAGDAAVGAYAAAYKIFEGTMILPSIILAATFPALVRAARSDRVGPAGRSPELPLAGGLLALGLGIGAAIHFTAAPLVHLVFGAAFADAVPSLRVLCLAIPLVFLNYGLTHFLIARHLERRNLAFAGFMVAVNVGLNMILIPRQGGPGAAWATFATEVGLTICCAAALALSGVRGPAAPPPAPGEEKRVRTSA